MDEANHMLLPGLLSLEDVAEGYQHHLTCWMKSRSGQQNHELQEEARTLDSIA